LPGCAGGTANHSICGRILVLYLLGHRRKSGAYQRQRNNDLP
jgi:hypothetical protein